MIYFKHIVLGAVALWALMLVGALLVAIVQEAIH